MIALTSTVASSHHGLAHAAVRAALLCGLALLASSCANRAEQYRLEDAAQRAEMAKRKAGETRLATLAEVTPELGCGGSRARAQIDSAEVLPARARPGTEITHRFVYSACDGGARPLQGTLVRKLILNRRTVFEEKRPMSLEAGALGRRCVHRHPAEGRAGLVWRRDHFRARRGAAVQLAVLPVVAAQLSGGHAPQPGSGQARQFTQALWFGPAAS
jgi:hypothetical protein